MHRSAESGANQAKVVRVQRGGASAANIAQPSDSDCGDVICQDSDVASDLQEEFDQFEFEGDDRASARLNLSTSSSIFENFKFVTLRKEWELDRHRTRELLTSVTSESPGRYSNQLGNEEDRIIHQLSFAVGRNPSCPSSAVSGPDWFAWGDEQAAPGFWDVVRAQLPLNPFSKGRTLWDLICFLMVSYDVVMIPLTQMVIKQVSRLDTIMALVANSVWTMDIALSFLTSTIQDGRPVTEWAKIARQYARSWLVLDLVMVVPEWVLVSLDSSRAGFSVLRVVKLFRAVRLLRMLKVASILQKQLQRFNSQGLLFASQLARLICSFLFLNHLVACCWYFIGSTADSGWLDERVIVWDGYLMALHWSISQFHGSTSVAPCNTTERIFAVVLLFIGMLTSSAFVSVVTNMIFQTRQARRKLNEQQARLRAYFSKHTVSPELMFSVKRHLQVDMDTSKDSQADQELTNAIPEQLGKTLMVQVRSATIAKYWIFKWISNEHHSAFREICYSLFTTMHGLIGHSIFERNVACSQMYFVESGTLRYINSHLDLDKEQAEKITRSHIRSSVGPNSRFLSNISQTGCGTEVSKTCWVCEPALWVQGWQTCGELIATVASILLRIEGSCFAEVLKCYPSLHLDVALYARWVLGKLKEDAENDYMSDLWKPDVDLGRVRSLT